MKTFLVVIFVATICAVVFMLGVWVGSVRSGERKTVAPPTTTALTNRYELHPVEGISGMMVKFDKVTGQSEIVPLIRPEPSPWVDSQTAAK